MLDWLSVRIRVYNILRKQIVMYLINQSNSNFMRVTYKQIPHSQEHKLFTVNSSAYLLFETCTQYGIKSV